MILIMAVLSLGSAGLVAYVSRTPADIRSAKPGPEANDPSLGASFTDEQVARHGAFRGPSYLAFATMSLLPIVLLVLLAKGPGAALVRWVVSIPGGWPVHALVAGALIAVAIAIVLLPLTYVRGYANAHAWGLSTQDLGGWVSDQLRSLGVGAAIAAISALAFFAVVRVAPKTWWLWGWAAFTALSALLVFLYPVAIAPLFNRFTSLEDGSLRQRILVLGEEAGVPLDDVLVADASRRTTTENAYVAGLGTTKQMVLFDNLLNNGSEEETVFVAAHELGHKAENHVLKSVAWTSLGLLVGFGVLYLLVERTGFLRWSGASSITDLRAIPALLLYLTVASLLTLPFQNAMSRNFERRADEIAIELTGDPEPGVRAFRRLAFSNLADLRPHPVAVWLLYTHPPIPDRIETFLRSFTGTSSGVQGHPKSHGRGDPGSQSRGPDQSRT